MKTILVCAGAASVALGAWQGASAQDQETAAAPTAPAPVPGDELPFESWEDPDYVVIYSVADGRLILADKVIRSEKEWKEILSPEQFEILRKKGTERAHSGALLKNREVGTYTCAGCGADLFTSETKFESATGWPSFYAPVAKQNVAVEVDDSYGVRRIEILCRRCGGHLGHVFDDGPPPTGLRFCVNSASLLFEKKREPSPPDEDAEASQHAGPAHAREGP